MAAKKAKQGSSETPEDKYKTIATVKDRAEAHTLMTGRGLDYIEGAEDKASGVIRITFHLTQAQIDDLKKNGFQLEVLENVSAIGRERQKEVGRGDRFDSGRSAPQGLGLKLREPQ